MTKITKFDKFYIKLAITVGTAFGLLSFPPFFLGCIWVSYLLSNNGPLARFKFPGSPWSLSIFEHGHNTDDFFQNGRKAVPSLIKTKLKTPRNSTRGVFL